MEPNWRETDYLKINQIRLILNCTYTVASRIAHSLPHVKIGSTAIRVSTPAFEKWLSDQERKNSR